MPDEPSLAFVEAPITPDIPSTRQKRAASFHFPGAGSIITRGANESVSLRQSRLRERGGSAKRLRRLP